MITADFDRLNLRPGDRVFDIGCGTGGIAKIAAHGNPSLRITAADRYVLYVAPALFGGGSYGNGGAMRAAPIGGYFWDDPERARKEAQRSAEVTHAHPEGQAGAAVRQVAADGCPAVAAIVRAPDALAGEVEPGRIMRADENGGIPVEALMGVSLEGLWLDKHLLSRGQVHPVQATLLGFRIDNVVVLGISGRLMTIRK